MAKYITLFIIAICVCIGLIIAACIVADEDWAIIIAAIALFLCFIFGIMLFNGTKCDDCGKFYHGLTIISNQQYCNECGAKIPYRVNKNCIKCGKELAYDDKFCQYCGTEQEKGKKYGN